MRRDQADFEVIAEPGGTVALVEVKNIPRLTPSSAAELRRDLIELEQSESPPAYFLVVSQESGYLWEPEQATVNDAKPAATFPMRQVLREYLTDQELDHHLRGGELEIAILQWLSDMTRGRGAVPPGSTSVARFAERVRGGTIHGGPRR